MVHRDPETGKFVETHHDQYEDIEVVTFRASAALGSDDLGAADNSEIGLSRNFEGLQVLDYDEVVDRNESLVLLEAAHRLVGYYDGSASNTPSTQYGVMAASAEISASPVRSIAGVEGSGAGSSFDDTDMLGFTDLDDSIDLLGRPMAIKASQDFSDSATGAGGGGGQAVDTVHLHHPPAEYGRFHPRDELFMNGFFRLWNSDVAGVVLTVFGQHQYGVVSE